MTRRGQQKEQGETNKVAGNEQKQEEGKEGAGYTNTSSRGIKRRSRMQQQKPTGRNKKGTG